MCFKKMLWGIWEMVGARAFKPLSLCFSTPENLLVRISGDIGTKVSHFLSKNVLRKCYGISQKQWMLELSNLCHWFQHPWKLTSSDFCSSRNESKQVFKQKCVLRKCCGVSQKSWVLELSKLCHCVQHPWKLTCKDFWRSRNKSKPLSKQKCVFEKMLWGIIRNSEC